MSFFTRLFRGPKTVQATNLARSQTVREPPPHSSQDSDDDGDESDVAGPLSAPESGAWRRGTTEPLEFTPYNNLRRQGGDMRRSHTVDCANAEAAVRTSGRHSMSSACSSSEDKLRQAYSKIKQCHRGKNAMVLQAVDRQSRRPVIVKAYLKHSMTPVRKDKMDREVAVLKHLVGSCGVVRYLAYIDEATHSYLILENVPGCTLIELMANSGGKLSETRCVVEVVFPLLKTLASLHAQGVVHRDLRPEHILCSLGSVKLVDFCESAQQRQQCLNHRAGQLEYMAPEVLDKPSAEEIFHLVLFNGMSEEELPQYDEKADVWSMGVVLFEVLTGQQPFMAETLEELAEMHARLQQKGPDGLPVMLHHPCISMLARQFLSEALQLDRAHRASAEQLLRHPWIAKHLATMQSQWLLPSPRASPKSSPHSSLDLSGSGQQHQTAQHKHVHAATAAASLLGLGPGVGAGKRNGHVVGAQAGGGHLVATVL